MAVSIDAVSAFPQASLSISLSPIRAAEASGGEKITLTCSGSFWTKTSNPPFAELPLPNQSLIIDPDGAFVVLASCRSQRVPRDRSAYQVSLRTVTLCPVALIAIRASPSCRSRTITNQSQFTISPANQRSRFFRPHVDPLGHIVF